MKSQVRRIMVGISLSIFLVLYFASVPDAYAHQNNPEVFSKQVFCKKQLKGEVFSRTELFFGLSKPGGSVVTEEEFQLFINNEVTPRFPDGLTLLTGAGQFKDSTGTITKEGSKLLMLFYPFNKESNNEIEHIREAYKDTFQQESVLRVDNQSCISF